MRSVPDPTPVIVSQLRAHGMATVLSSRDRRERLLARCAGMLWVVALWSLASALLENALKLLIEDGANIQGAEGAENPAEIGTVGAYLLLSLGLFVVAPFIGFAINAVLRGKRGLVADSVGAAAAIAVLAIPILTSPLTIAGPSATSELLPRLVESLLAVAVVVGAAYFGLGSLLVWAGRRVSRELTALGPMVARVLPVFTLASLFLFYNAEIWQVMVALSWKRVGTVAAVLCILATLLIVIGTADDLKGTLSPQALTRAAAPEVHGCAGHEHIARPDDSGAAGQDHHGAGHEDVTVPGGHPRWGGKRSETPEAHRAVTPGAVDALTASGGEGAVPERPAAPIPTVPLRIRERLNLFFIPIAVTMVQAVLFALIVFIFFTAFGELSVSDATIEQWTGHPASRQWWDMYGIPLDPTLIKVSITLAAIGILNFAASASSDDKHRETFVTPIVAEAYQALELREQYLRLGVSGEAPAST